MLENKSSQNEFNEGPEHRSQLRDRGGVNGLLIGVEMRKLEAFKVGLNFFMTGQLKEATIWIEPGHSIPTNSVQILGEIMSSLI